MRYFSKCFIALALVVLGSVSPTQASSIIGLPDLVSVSFFERSFATPTEFVFDFDSSEMTTLLSDPLGSGNRDFIGTTFGADENYDVFYSNADGTFNLNGAYISVTATYDYAGDSGLNLAGVRLNFSSGPGEFANSVASFVALGSSPLPGTVGFAVDGDIYTHTFMGDTHETSDRLRVTVGFDSTVVPLPAALPLFTGGLGLLGLLGWRRNRLTAA